MRLYSALSVLLLAGVAAAQSNKAALPYTPPNAGAEMYMAYCASCHGKDARGNGPAAPALKVPPTDLTTLASKSHGKFPRVRVYQIIKSGGSIAAHGSKEMPMWGAAFRSLRHEGEAEAEAQIRTLVDYLQTLQTK